MEVISYQLEKDLLLWRSIYDKPFIMTEYGADAVAGLHEVRMLFNNFMPLVSNLYPLKTSGNMCFFDVFRCSFQGRGKIILKLIEKDCSKTLLNVIQSIT